MRPGKKKKPQAKALVIPMHMMHLVMEGKITLQHAAVFALIDAFSKMQLGCILKNETIAKKLGVSERSVRNYLADLKKWDLIIQVFFNGRVRRLKTVSTARLEESLEKAFGAKVANFAGQHGRTCRALLRSSNRSYVAAQNTATESGGLLQNGKHHSTPSLGERLAAKLRDGLAVKQALIKRNVSIAKWGNEFSKLLQSVDKKVVKRSLAGYLDHFDLDDQYMPKALSASSFREKFIGVQQWLKRKEKDLDVEERPHPLTIVDDDETED